MQQIVLVVFRLRNIMQRYTLLCKNLLFMYPYFCCCGVLVKDLCKNTFCHTKLKNSEVQFIVKNIFDRN